MGDDANSSSSSQPIYDIPRVQGIAIDGGPSAWADRGLQIHVLHTSFPRPSTDKSDASLSLAWDDRGLLVLANVIERDITPEDLTPAGGGPSINVYQSDKVGGKLRWQSTIEVTSNPDHPHVQCTRIEQKTQSDVFFDPSVLAATKKTDNGFVIEALLPWDALGLKAERGREIGLHIYVNVGPQLFWFGARGAEWNTSLMRDVRLADATGSRVIAAADGEYEHLRRARIAIAATADQVGKQVLLKSADNLLGQAELTTGGRLAIGQMSLPMPGFGEQYGPLDVWLDGKRIDQLTMPDADGQRKDAIGDLYLDVDSVFKGPDFPAVEFGNPGDAEDALGEYSIHTTFYDRDYNQVTRARRPGRYGAAVEVASPHQKPLKYFITLYRPADGFNWRLVRMKTALPLPPEMAVDTAVAREQTSAQGEFLADYLRDGRYRTDDFAVLLAGLSESSPGSGDLPRRVGPEGRNVSWWYGLKKKLGDLTPYQYLVHVPDSAKNGAQKSPLIIFLHGSGERGDDLNIVARNGPPKILNVQPDWQFKDQFIVVSPQCPARERWNPLQLRDLLDELESKYPIDPDRVYLTGLSMGGYGSWDMAEWFPDLFAAIAPCCGGGDPLDAPRVKDLPAWVFHGGVDPVVPIFDAYEMVKALRDIHGRVKFTVFPKFGHNSWEPMYDDPDLYNWLLAQRRGQPAQSPSELPDTRPDAD